MHKKRILRKSMLQYRTSQFKYSVLSKTVVMAIPASLSSPSVEAALASRGWHRLQDKSSTAFTLKWVELKQHIDYRNFREGQLV